MPLWRQFVLSLYYHGTYPQRCWRNARLRAGGKSPVMVLFYHRIADYHPNDWTASNRMFARQMRWLRRHFDMVSLTEAQRRVRLGYNDRPCVSITFDDGYADNCRQALPLLIEERIPCTYFVSTRYVLEGLPFPHDVARGCPLEPNSPQQIRELARAGIEIGAHTRTHLDLGCTSDRDVLFDELVGARRELQAMTDTEIRYFAFPYGQHANLNPRAFEIAREVGYEAVCSAYGGFNFPGDDPFHLQRIHVDDDLIRLKNWTTVDPRKLRAIKPYDYRKAAADSSNTKTLAEAAGVCL